MNVKGIQGSDALTLNCDVEATGSVELVITAPSGYPVVIDNITWTENAV